MTVPRPEYPRPQFVRNDWLCLNGTWQFEIDHADSGIDRGLLSRDLKDKIIVPFCPESKLSGIGYTDFMDAVWYRRTVQIPTAWTGKRILLHFQAVDYDATVWVNGKEVARHRGGFTPFSGDLDGLANAGQTITIVLRARDNCRAIQPRGKQCPDYASRRCHYTRTTGIWQSVWMEPVPQTYMNRPRITPDVTNSAFHLAVPLFNPVAGLKLRATVRDKQGVVVTRTVPADVDFSANLDLPISQDRRRLWSPSDPHLYDIDLELLDRDGKELDKLASYAGLRCICIDGQAVKINGQSIFQRLVLDQGYYPEGNMTAPSDEALRKDIELAMAAGFNGARLHQKVFEERFLYHADRIGYLCWGEFADWSVPSGPSRFNYREGPDGHGFPTTFITQWLQVLHRDYSHPCIIGWCALNENHRAMGEPNLKRDDRIMGLDDAILGMFLAAKAIDTTRPVLDVSGYCHRVSQTDVYDCHDYEQDPEKLRVNQQGLKDGKPFYNGTPETFYQVPYRGQPFFNSEFGGTWWQPGVDPNDPSWGYGRRPKDINEFYDRFEKLCAVLLENEHMFGYCYTQLTDVEQEQNGIYFYDRKLKFDMERIRRAQQRPAAIERGDHK